MYIKILQILMSLINTNVLLIVQRVKEIFVKYGFKLLNEYYVDFFFFSVFLISYKFHILQISKLLNFQI